MLKKLLLFLIITVVSIQITNCFASCSYDGVGNLSKSLIEGCVDPEGRNLVTGNMELKGEFKAKIENWINTISNVLGTLAVFAIIYGSFTLVTSIGEDDKVKKGKDIIKWGIIGFLGVIGAGTLIKVIIGVLIV